MYLHKAVKPWFRGEWGGAALVFIAGRVAVCRSASSAPCLAQGEEGHEHKIPWLLLGYVYGVVVVLPVVVGIEVGATEVTWLKL